MVLYLPFKSAHRRCGVAPSMGSRDGHANELQSAPCVICSPLPRRRDPSRIEATASSGELTREAKRI
jgi:hypothetical protein